ncbi:MAG: NosD domain-containing protein, partial [Candidatus Aenigmatarchaeota archaeon]
MARKTMFHVSILLGLLFALAAFSSPAAALSCGDTITASTTLTGNLGPCSGNGIVIGANNIELNCNGYSITGTGTGNGIYLGGRTNVTIKNCIISKFSYGIYLYSSSNNTLTNNTANSNSNWGIYLKSNSNYNTLTNNTANSNSNCGINLESSSYNTLTNNTFNSNQV